MNERFMKCKFYIGLFNFEENNMSTQMMSTAMPHEGLPVFEMNQGASFSLLESLQNRIETLETQLKKAIHQSNKKEAYANTLESDLEHIISQLQRLEIVKAPAVAA